MSPPVVQPLDDATSLAQPFPESGRMDRSGDVARHVYTTAEVHEITRTRKDDADDALW